MRWVTGRAGCTNLMQWAVAGEGDPSVVFLGAVLMTAMVCSGRCRRYRHRICELWNGLDVEAVWWEWSWAVGDDLSCRSIVSTPRRQYARVQVLATSKIK